MFYPDFLVATLHRCQTAKGANRTKKLLLLLQVYRAPYTAGASRTQGFSFQVSGPWRLTWTSIAGHHSLENASALRGEATLQWRGCAMRWALWQDRGTEGSSNHTHSDEERRFMYQNRPSKSHQLPFDQGVQIVIPPRSPASVPEPIRTPSDSNVVYYVN